MNYNVSRQVNPPCVNEGMPADRVYKWWAGPARRALFWPSFSLSLAAPTAFVPPRRVREGRAGPTAVTAAVLGRRA